MNLHWRLSHARGYLALGMLRQAEAELRSVRGEDADRMEIKALLLAILHQKRDWRRLRRLAAELVKREPTEADWWVSLAFATRRVQSIDRARRILLEAEQLHPKEAVIQFNLGCYACQLGELEEARRRVMRSIALHASFREAAVADEDLAPLRAADPDFPG
jgi:lipopolysaccharide biosynthesis regulator YciM